ncbi:hypothetical protein QBC46DRAFT_379369 [Diplogelasinospora grovesii]|uniref:DUF6546 domain-containing protein n=1 Tax=Diplogelasinospora grovesii TaxID=303347 RepID=A0AAN6NFH8_9PEZI|nr:hypothetical protein QBC46DRAFT_379369 [Diplogelasinospora grovesii]
MTADKTSWHCLPAEIRIMILEVLLQDGCSLAGFATVSGEWQSIIEQHNFARIHLTSSRLADFGSIIHRNRALVRYVWLCLELREYDCAECAPDDREMWGLSNTDNIVITAAFQDLFSTLSAWEPNGNLLLDISVHSPSDSEHWFKYLTFGPDVPSDECDRGRCAEQSMLVQVDDHQHGWIAGSRDSAPPFLATYKVFDEIMGEGPFDGRQLPSVPAVTGVLLRQQNRRRWKPTALAQVFARLPSLQEIHYEPWREWDDIQQKFTDRHFRSLFESLASSQLRRLVLFENFNQQYALSFRDCVPIRIPTPGVSRAVARASLELEHLSASFMVDASYFFDAREPSWKWPNLTSLALTSRLLAPDESPMEIDNMLRAAAAATMKMPNLKTMEIWNGQEGLAMLFRYQPAGGGQPAVITWRGTWELAPMLFRYQPAGGGQPAVITWRGTWELALRPPVIEAWEAVALKHRGHGLVIVKELLNAGAVVKSHGDAIHHLKLSIPVIRPVSLRQIRMEHRIRELVHN